MVQYQGQDELDKARAEWFQLAGERRRQKEEIARKTEEAKRLHKEWWGLDPETGKLRGRAAEVEGDGVEGIKDGKGEGKGKGR
jgi:COX assembly protein 1